LANEKFGCDQQLVDQEEMEGHDSRVQGFLPLSEAGLGKCHGCDEEGEESRRLYGRKKGARRSQKTPS
jgi:hypothetical protein